MESVRRTLAPASPQPQTPGAARASLPGFHDVVVVMQEHRDAECAHSTRCVAQVDQVVCAHGHIQLIRTDAGLVIDLPAEAVAQLTVNDEIMVRRP
jgi:hypothetical protein